MLKGNRLLLGLIGVVVVIGVFGFPSAIAQRNATTNFFEGRGIAQGSIFSRGQNANVALTLDGNNFRLDNDCTSRNAYTNPTDATHPVSWGHFSPQQ